MAPERFTVEEANDLLPYLAPLLVQIRALKGEHDRSQEKVAELTLKMRSNGHILEDELRLKREALEKAAAKLAELVERVQSYGCQLKDMEMGLIDFPAIRDGREVYLCWKLGEEQIGYWHDVEAGYAGRQPLEDSSR